MSAFELRARSIASRAFGTTSVPGRYAKVENRGNSENLAKSLSSMFSLLQGPVGSIRQPMVDLVRNDVISHVAACRTHQRA
jgi:hypothetical protein